MPNVELGSQGPQSGEKTKKREIAENAAAFAVGVGLGYGAEKLRQVKGHRDSQRRERAGAPRSETARQHPDGFTPYGNLPDELRAVYGSEASYNEHIESFKALLGDEQSRTEAYSERLTAQMPETEQFRREIEDPHFQTVDSIPTKDPEGFRFACYRLNRDKAGVPLVVNLGFAQGAESRIGRPFLQAIAAKNERPIIVIDTVGTGKTSIPKNRWVMTMNFEKIAQAEREVLDRELGDVDGEEFDMVGVSQGGVISKELAALYGDRVRKVVTASTPGFQKRTVVGFAKAFGYDEAKLDAVIREKGDYKFTEQDAFYNQMYGPPVTPLNLPPEMFSPEKYPTLLKIADLLRKEVMLDTPAKLSPRTEWIDLLGTKDRITSYQPHLAVVRQKPNASIHLLADASHAYSNPQPTTMAEDISQLLQASDQRAAA